MDASLSESLCEEVEYRVQALRMQTVFRSTQSQSFSSEQQGSNPGTVAELAEGRWINFTGNTHIRVSFL